MTDQLLTIYENYFNEETSFASLLLSPPGAGKTTLIAKLFDHFKDRGIFKNIILICPLRAIVEELGERFIERRDFHIILSGDEKSSKIEDLVKKNKPFFVSTTPESFGLQSLEIVDHKNTLIVFDEIHLFTYWGESFRPYLSYFFQESVTKDFSILCLTATYDQKFLEIFDQDIKRNYDHYLVFNFGNQLLKNLPNAIYDYSWLGKKLLFKVLTNTPREIEGTNLIFCRTRNEVFKYCDYFQRLGFKTLGCVGGEVKHFQEELKKMKRPDFIFSTLALSHGVNLPPIRKVYILFKVEIHDFYIQMVGRGGRDDLGYELYLYDSNFSFFEKLKYSWKALAKWVSFGVRL